LSAFDEWKARLEAEAAAHGDPEAAEASMYRKAKENRLSVIKTFVEFQAEVFNSLPEDESVEIVASMIEDFVGDMTSAAPAFVRKHPDEAEGILWFYELEIGFYKRWAQALRGRDWAFFEEDASEEE